MTTAAGPDVRSGVAVLGLGAVTLLLGLALRRRLVSLSGSVVIGFFTPPFVKREVVIFDDVTPKWEYGSASGGAPKFVQYTCGNAVVRFAYHGKTYCGFNKIRVVVSSDEGIRLLQHDQLQGRFDYHPFPVPYAEELRAAIQSAIDTSSLSVNKRDFPPPTVDEIKRATKLYGEWWGRSIRFWLLPFSNNRYVEQRGELPLGDRQNRGEMPRRGAAVKQRVLSGVLLLRASAHSRKATHFNDGGDNRYTPSPLSSFLLDNFTSFFFWMFKHQTMVGFIEVRI